MLRKSYIRALAVAAAWIVISGCTAPQEGKAPRNNLATPEETVKAYCDLDAKATRLSSETWSKVRPYIAWEEEAGWDRTVVISGFSVVKVQKESDAASTIAVEYQVRGILSGDYVRSPKTEKVTFTVKKFPEGWKITSPDFMPPHVLMQPLVKHLEETKNIEMAGKLKDAKE